MRPTEAPASTLYSRHGSCRKTRFGAADFKLQQQLKCSVRSLSVYREPLTGFVLPNLCWVHPAKFGRQVALVLTISLWTGLSPTTT